jgi:hypothetical protein
MLYLFGDRAAGIAGRRFVAAHWDAALPPDQAAYPAGAPAGCGRIWHARRCGREDGPRDRASLAAG